MRSVHSLQNCTSSASACLIYLSFVFRPSGKPHRWQRCCSSWTTRALLSSELDTGFDLGQRRWSSCFGAGLCWNLLSFESMICCSRIPDFLLSPLYYSARLFRSPANNSISTLCLASCTLLALRARSCTSCSDYLIDDSDSSYEYWDLAQFQKRYQCWSGLWAFGPSWEFATGNCLFLHVQSTFV